MEYMKRPINLTTQNYRVREAENKKTGKKVAIKIFDKEQLIKIKDLGLSIKKEVTIL
jgi:hypothetical protein